MPPGACGAHLIRDAARSADAFVLELSRTPGRTVVFFGLQKIGAAVATIVVLDVGVAVTALAFRPIDRWAGLLMVPYLAWVVFATVLNIAIWCLNPRA